MRWGEGLLPFTDNLVAGLGHEKKIQSTDWSGKNSEEELSTRFSSFFYLLIALWMI